MYETLCAKTGVRHDPCVIDVFISVTRFMAGETPRPWWDYTAQRKQLLIQFGGGGLWPCPPYGFDRADCADRSGLTGSTA